MTSEPEPTGEPTGMEKFVDLARMLLKVPKSEVDEQRRRRSEDETQGA
jgi:hypothetical protein